MRQILISFLLLIISFEIYAEPDQKKAMKYSEVTVSCTAEYIESKSIVISWVETNYSLPIFVQDGFHNQLYTGQVTSNAFTWDRGTNIGVLDRYTGVLTIRPKDGTNGVSARCAKVEKKF